MDVVFFDVVFEVGLYLVFDGVFEFGSVDYYGYVYVVVLQVECGVGG